MIEDDRQDDAPLEDAEPTAAPDEAPAEPSDTPPDVTESAAEGDAPSGEGGEHAAEGDAPESGEGGGHLGGAREEDVAGDEASQPADEVPSVEDLPAPDSATGDGPAEAIEGETAAEAEPAAEQRPSRKDTKADEAEVIPGAHLEPDLVLEQPAEGEGDEYAQYAEPAAEGEEPEEGDAEPAVAVRSPLDLAADARYQATGKRKTAIARVVVKPGTGAYTVNGRSLEEFFPRIRLQKAARQPLEATGNHQRMDVVARIHGGGVAAQAGALRHGIARALVDASPELRTELKRRGYLTRDPREKERRKAGLKKARKRPQFSKR